jgi:hypothetical protein
MSTLETILIRAMNDTAFADHLFTDAETALAEYALSADEVLKLKGLSRAQFDAMPPEERKSMSLGPSASGPMKESMETMKKA